MASNDQSAVKIFLRIINRKQLQLCSLTFSYLAFTKQSILERTLGLTTSLEVGASGILPVGFKNQKQQQAETKNFNSFALNVPSLFNFSIQKGK